MQPPRRLKNLQEIGKDHPATQPTSGFAGGDLPPVVRAKPSSRHSHADLMSDSARVSTGLEGVLQTALASQVSTLRILSLRDVVHKMSLLPL